jgi:uncharacterized protein YozE (UPF0346 family)
MKKMIKFPSIEQFRTVVTNVNRHFNYIGLDENGDAIYDVTLPKPKLTLKVLSNYMEQMRQFVITLKVMGSICENIITPEKR